MIFKTFENNDIDKWTSKIGIFGKSFNELGTIINNVFKTYLNDIDDFDKNISFWDALKENLFSKDDNWIKNSLGEIVSKDNIDSYIKELDLDSAKQKLLDIAYKILLVGCQMLSMILILDSPVLQNIWKGICLLLIH